MDPVPGAPFDPVVQGQGEPAGNRFECPAGLAEEVVMVAAGPLEPGLAVAHNDGLPVALGDGLTGRTENG